MSDKKHLYILWTDDNLITAQKMVFMYAINARKNGWWEQVTLIVWGATAQLVHDNPTAQTLIAEALEHGIHITACKACADQLGVSEKLSELGIVVEYLGVPLTNLLKSDEVLLTV